MTIKCKCGVEWASILYGNSCGKCGDIRPEINPTRKTINLNAYRNEIMDMHSTVEGIFSEACHLNVGFQGTLDVKSTQSKNKNIYTDLQFLADILKNQRDLEKEHNEILKEVAQILISQNRPCIDGGFIVFVGEVEELYKQVKEKRNFRFGYESNFQTRTVNSAAVGIVSPIVL